MPAITLPYLMEGEIVDVQGHVEGGLYVTRYNVEVTLKDGFKTILPNVRMGTILGGIGDYWRRRARTRADDSEFNSDFQDQNNLDASVGERVFVACVNGNILNPVIIAFANHPAQPDEPSINKDSDPNLVFQYLGVRQTWGENGDFTILHKGAPQTKFKPGGGLSLPTLPGDTPGKSPALDDADDENLIKMEFIEGGIFRIRDYKGGTLEFDHSKDRIFLATNYLDSKPEGLLSFIPATGMNDEFLLLDRSAGLVQIQAKSAIELKTIQTGAIKIDGLKIAIGNPSAELLDLVDQFIEQTDKLIEETSNIAKAEAVHIHPSSTGPTGPPTNAADFTAAAASLQVIKTQLGVIKSSLGLIKGSL